MALTLFYLHKIIDSDVNSLQQTSNVLFTSAFYTSSNTISVRDKTLVDTVRNAFQDHSVLSENTTNFDPFVKNTISGEHDSVDKNNSISDKSQQVISENPIIQSLY